MGKQARKSHLGLPYPGEPWPPPFLHLDFSFPPGAYLSGQDCSAALNYASVGRRMPLAARLDINHGASFSGDF